MVLHGHGAMVLSTEWAQVEVVELSNDGNGLGFNLVGGRSTGVVIKYILPGSAADKDGRLQSGDHVLQVGSVNLRGFTSEQVAAVLRQAGPAVRLLVARPADPAAALRAPIPGTALVPTKLLADPELLDRHLIECGYGAVYDLSQCYEEYINGENGETENIVAAAVSVIGDHPLQIPDHPIVTGSLSPTITITVPVELPDLPEVEIVHVDLSKNVYGLGITVAGYVCEKEELSGIFVKSIIEGSSAEQSGKIKLNDRIIEVDGVSLADKSNPQAVEILRNTGISVHLVLERYLRGPKFEHLQLAIFNEERPPSPTSSTTTLSWFPVPSQADNSTTLIEPDPESNTTIDSNVLEIGDIDLNEPSQEELDRRLDEILAVDKEEIRKKWEAVIGSNKEIIIAEVNKLEGLGISLEGTVDVEGGQELRPHHYIRSVLPEGPVGQQGTLIAGDELLEANEYRLHGLTHTEVVNILKQLPNRVRLVCSRSVTESGPRPVINLASDREGFEARKIISGSLNNLTTIIKAQSDTSINTSSTATLTNHSGISRKSRSLECVSGLAMWQSKEDIVELVKGDQGLGFSILDYQDPLDPKGTVIVVRSLVPGGVAEKNGEISPGDRVMSVNGISIKNATLDQAVQALKGAPRGVVKVGISRPLPPSDASTSKSKSTTTLNTKPS
ncbi:PDZ domain (Also known as DHR or GLGF) domain-containing protein [Phthorimaea operculella]|nr:PDZ domain (Also known as DHR or GLGF) domain-containing protein [Phthorimaea operculella]